MSRRAREISGTGIYHVMMRGINRQNIFEDDESKVQVFDSPLNTQGSLTSVGLFFVHRSYKEFTMILNGF